MQSIPKTATAMNAINSNLGWYRFFPETMEKQQTVIKSRYNAQYLLEPKKTFL